ncbi:MAG: hypothetical protein LQ343_003229 [Gyalolechia ehrenbergii]|nr:MAG: hypothetical protein LQ343_003229 [Gyalolechia ehrenbergii]
MSQSHNRSGESSGAQRLLDPTHQQADHEGPVQDALAQMESMIIVPESCGAPTHEANYPGFIPTSDLQAEFTKPRKIEDLLNALIKSTFLSRQLADNIRTHYLRPFMILICAGHGGMIRHFVEHQSLEDNKLPFQGRPPDFPASSGSNSIWQKFNEHQWKFCAINLRFNKGFKQLSEHDILPIIRKTSIAGGASAATSRIEVHPDYDQLRDGRLRSNLDSDAQCSHTYVLKTYNTPQAKRYHEAEMNGFQILDNDTSGEENNIISYYGSFAQMNAEKGMEFNTIFEYAEFGTLEDFMMATDPPSTAAELNKFWERFLEITRGLVLIHGRAPPDAQMGDAILLGWHQDIKPKNILVCRNPDPSSKYDHIFKLADLGLSHFKMHVGASHSVTDQDTSGTRTYGAPEVHRNHRIRSDLHLDIKQGVDIWSMGCVISEIAVWLVHGYQYLLEYRRRRSAEFRRKSADSPTDCFHDGRGSVLDVVKKIHHDLHDNFRSHDDCTGEVLDKLVNRMIVAKADARLNARFIHEESKRIIESLEKPTQRRLINSTEGGLQWTHLKLPPILPPGYESMTMSQPYEPPLEHETRLPLDTPLDRARYKVTLDSRTSYSDASPPRTTSYYRNEDASPNLPYQHVPTMTLVEPAAGGNNIPIADWGGYSRRRISSRMNTDPVVHQQGMSQNNRFNVETEDTQEILEARQAFPRRETRNMPIEDNFYRHSGDATATDSHSGTSRQSSQADQVHKPQEQDEMAPQNHHPAKQKPKAMLTVQEGLDWKHKKERGKVIPLPNKHLLEELRSRDHVFLVDTAKTMARYQTQVKEIVELLGFMVTPYDDDGIELYLSCNEESAWYRKSRDVSKFLDQLDEVHLSDRPSQPNFALPFGKIIEKYQSRLTKKYFREHLGFDPKRPPPLSLYVITDGVWQPGCEIAVEKTIVGLVDLLEERHLTNAQVGIQFIRVGDDANGERRLEKLDRCLDRNQDIVDTTHSTGNVWKMLQGPISRWYDDDP